MHKFLVILLLSLTAISCSKKMDRASSAPVEFSKFADSEEAKAEGGEGEGQVETKQAAAPQERMIIRTANLTLVAEAPDAAARKVTAHVEQVKGYVVETNNDGGSGWKRVTLKVRVPSTSFDAALETFRGLGEVGSEQVLGQDVTEEFVDLGARLGVQRALENRMVELLAESKTVEDTIRVESELARIREVIETMDGRSRFLADQTAMSTIVVTIGSKSVSTEKGFGSEIAEAFGDAGDIMEAVIAGLIRVVAGLIPIAIVVGIFMFGLLAILRRRKAAKKL
jgi:hypothetical protein